MFKIFCSRNEKNRKASSTKWVKLLKIKITSSMRSKVSYTLSSILTAFLIKMCNYTLGFTTMRCFLPLKSSDQPKRYNVCMPGESYSDLYCPVHKELNRKA